MTYADRKAQGADWEQFTKRLGVDIVDTTIRTNDALIAEASGNRRKACVPEWLRELILAKTTWREAEQKMPADIRVLSQKDAANG